MALSVSKATRSARFHRGKENAALKRLHAGERISLDDLRELRVNRERAENRLRKAMDQQRNQRKEATAHG